MRATTKSAKIHPAAKKCCGWEEPAIYDPATYHSALYRIIRIVIYVNIISK